jgi:carboxypeptidase family protein/TonB-dependent receptor-like protein
MRMQRMLKVLVLFLIPLLTALPSMGQVSYDTATLQGTVLDAQGRAVPGARVTISNTATGLTKSQESGADGTYTFPLLPVGTYQAEVTAPGFSRAVASNVVLSVGQALVQDMRLRLGETTATVTVTSEAPLLSVEQVQQANEITQSQVATLPNVNHTFDTYVLTLPGITNIYAIRNAGSQRAGAANVNSFTTSAGNGRGGLVTIDGGENDTGEGISRTYHLPVDAIDEFLVNRNGYNAEYGFSYEEMVTIVTKTGTNNYHGSAFGTFRDQSTDARQYFQPLSPSGNKFFDQEFHAGGSLGGPIVKNKLFFFLAYEGYQNAFETSRNFINPTYSPTFTQLPSGQQAYINALAADANASHCSPASSCAALAADLTAALNPSNSAVVRALVGAPGNFLGQPSQTGNFTNKDNWHDAVLRFDWQPNANDSFVLRGLLERRDNAGDYGALEYFQNATVPPDNRNVLTNRDYEWVATWNHIFTPMLFNALRFQIIPEFLVNSQPIPAQNGPRIPYNILPSYGSFGVTLGPGVGNLLHEKRFQIEDSTSWIHGKHSFKFGLSYRPAKYDWNNPLYSTSQIVYSASAVNLYGLGGPDCAGISLTGASTYNGCGGTALGSYTPPLTANDLSAISSFNNAAAANATLFKGANLNALQSFSGVVPIQFRTSFGNAQWAGWGHYGGIYAQDTWKVTPRLTISPGVRFDVNAEPFPRGGTDNNVCEATSPTVAAVTALQTALKTPGMTCAGAGGIVRSFQINPTSGHTNYVSPRLGFAFDLTGDGKTLLRASGGAFVGASELQTVFYSNIYNPNGQYLIQEEVTPGADLGYFALIKNSTANGHLPVLAPTLADFNSANLSPKPFGQHGVFITAADRPCGGDNIFGCGAYRSTYSTQASLSIQRELWANISLEVGYVFQRTFHVQDPLENNYQQAVDPASGAPLIDSFNGPMLVPKDVNVETGTLYCSCGDAIYHAVTTSFKRQFANHFQFQANYTWSSAVDNVLDFSSFNSSYYPTLYPTGLNGEGRDWGVSAYNVTHNLVANAVYTTPFKGGSGANWANKLLADWTLSPIVTAHSGIPFEVLINPTQGLGSECTTVAACAAGAANGNGLVQEAQNQARPFAAGRNTGLGPWNYRWDMSFRKAIPLGERFRMEFLANFANLLNRVNFLGVNGVFPGVTNAKATGAGQSQNVKLLDGSTVNLLSGPYNFHGYRSFNDAELSGTKIGGGTPLANGADPLAFATADVPRQAQFELRLSF